MKIRFCKLCDCFCDTMVFLLQMNIARKKNIFYPELNTDTGNNNKSFTSSIIAKLTPIKQRPYKELSRFLLCLEYLLNLLSDFCTIWKQKNNQVGSEFIDPITISVNLLIDTRYLKSITDISRYSRHLEATATLLTRLKRNHFTTSGLCCNYL